MGNEIHGPSFHGYFRDFLFRNNYSFQIKIVDWSSYLEITKTSKRYFHFQRSQALQRHQNNC